MRTGKPFLPFNEFLRSLEYATYKHFRSIPYAEVENADAFLEMKQHLQEFYDGVEAPHSFMDDAGFMVDCVPFEQQPARRGSKEPPLTAPVLPDLSNAYAGRKVKKGVLPPPPLHPDNRDPFGNQMWCPSGTVPIIRTTLEQFVRRRTLREFLRKEPPQSFRNQSYDKLDDNGHRYATGQVRIPNVGGSSFLNVWKPPCLGSQNSISQQWYSAGPQFVECGWQVCPSNWNGDTHPHLFVFYTPDAYTSSAGGFLVGFEYAPNVTHYIGQRSLFSTMDGVQYENEMGFFLNNGAWWLWFNGQWLGFYRTSLFGSGPLVFGAETAEFGGEAAIFGTFPPMGSGSFPGGGFGKVAYQRNVLIFKPTHAEVPDLSPAADTPNCYRIQIANNSPTDWGTHFWFGGIGGLSC